MTGVQLRRGVRSFRFKRPVAICSMSRELWTGPLCESRMTDKLTPKQERFWIEYLATGNASEAYRRAYNTAGMDDRTIQKRAGELLAHGVIAGAYRRSQGQGGNQRHLQP